MFAVSSDKLGGFQPQSSWVARITGVSHQRLALLALVSWLKRIDTLGSYYISKKSSAIVAESLKVIKVCGNTECGWVVECGG
jgi:hypothetical protein